MFRQLSKCDYFDSCLNIIGTHHKEAVCASNSICDRSRALRMCEKVTICSARTLATFTLAWRLDTTSLSFGFGAVTLARKSSPANA